MRYAETENSLQVIDLMRRSIAYKMYYVGTKIIPTFQI